VRAVQSAIVCAPVGEKILVRRPRSGGFWRRFGSDRRRKIVSELAPGLLLLIIGIIGTVREADCSECSESATEESLYVTAAVRSAKWMARPYLCVASIERENCATHLLAVALIGVESASQANVGVGSHDQNLLVFRPWFQWGGGTYTRITGQTEDAKDYGMRTRHGCHWWAIA
jgi:hypothetical protein